MTISNTDVSAIEERVGDPGATANVGKVYTKDVATVTQLFYQASDGTVTQLSPAAGATTLQSAYNGGQTIAIANALGAVAMNRNAGGIGAAVTLLQLQDNNTSNGRTAPLLNLDDTNDGTGESIKVNRNVVGGVGIRSLVGAVGDRALVGGNTAPLDTFVAFGDGDTVIGGAVMVGTEKLRVVGAGRIEGILDTLGNVTIENNAGGTFGTRRLPGDGAGPNVALQGGAATAVGANTAFGGGESGVQAGDSAAEATGTGEAAGAQAFVRAGNAAAGAGGSAVNGGSISFEVGDPAAGGSLGAAVFRNRAGNATPDVIPRADAEGNLGTAARRWNLIRGVTITSGAYMEEEVFGEETLPLAKKIEALIADLKQNDEGLRHLARIAMVTAQAVVDMNRAA